MIEALEQGAPADGLTPAAELWRYVALRATGGS